MNDASDSPKEGQEQRSGRERQQAAIHIEQFSLKLAAAASFVYESLRTSCQVVLRVISFMIKLANYLKTLVIFLRYPITGFMAVLVFICLYTWLVMSAYNFGISLLPESIQNGFSLVFKFSSIFIQGTICSIPLVNTMAPFCPGNAYLLDPGGLVAVQEFTFNSLSDNSLTHLNTAVDITHMTDQSLPDLIHLLKHSELPGKAIIMEALTDVISEGRPTARNLQKFGGAVQSSLDVVIAANRVYMLRLTRGQGLGRYFTSTGKSNVRLLWRALVLFGTEIESINAAFLAARNSLLILQARLRGALTVIREELHLETQDRDLLWRNLWDQVIHRGLIAQHSLHITYLERAFNVTSECLNHVTSAQVAIDVASDGFSFLKDRLDLYIDSKDPDVVELQYETVVQSIQRLSDLRINGFGKGER